MKFPNCLRGALAAACLALGSAAWSDDGAALGAALGPLLDHARAHSPELAALRLEAQAAERRVEPAGALPDPVLRMELMNINNYGSDAAPSLLPSRVGETRYTLMQSLPAWGKRGLRREAAAAEARQAQSRNGAAWVDLAARIKGAFADYYRVAGSERLVREQQDLAVRLEQVARARYAGGLAAQQDAIRAQLEQTALQAELIALDNEKRQLRARLNALAGRDSQAPLAEPQALRALPSLAVADAPVLAERARTASPQLAEQQARLDAAHKVSELARRNRQPDFQVGIVPTQVGSRITAWGVMVELNLPLQQGARRAQEAESQALADAARARLDALSLQLQGELAAQLSALDAAQRGAALLRTRQLPQAELALQSSLAAYESGKGDFAALLEAQRQIRKARQDLLRAQAEAQQRLAEIERIVGEEL